jgi:PBSX family phage terminase large subunit
MSVVLDRQQEQRPYQRYGAADIMWKSRRREILLAGPGDTGKSRACLEKFHFCADKYAGARLLIVRKTRKSLTQSAMVTYEQKVLPEGWLGKRGKRGLIHFNTSDQQYEYPNGSIIAVGGLDNPEKVLSSEWDMIYPQEATELSENNWEILTMRLRNSVMPYQQLIADCNPSYPTHWLKMRCDRGATLMLNSRHEDNPSITPERIAVLDALTGVRKLRLRHGIWAAAEGMVYEEWDEAVHKVTHEQLRSWHILTNTGEIDPVGTKRVIAGIDWGWTNPGTILVLALDHDGRMYLIHEVYQTQKTDDWWVERGCELKKRYGIDAFVCDPAMPAYIAKFKAAGLNAVEADNDIATGVNDARERLHVAGDGRPRFYLYEYALRDRDQSRVDARQPHCFDGEILEYVWPKAQDGKPVKELPVAVNNHALDAWRYACRWLADPANRTATQHLEAMQRRAELAKQRGGARA